jgi:hypothetical protein
VRPGDAHDPLGQFRPAQHPPGLVLQLDVVVLLGPVAACCYTTPLDVTRTAGPIASQVRSDLSDRRLPL